MKKTIILIVVSLIILSFTNYNNNNEMIIRTVSNEYYINGLQVRDYMEDKVLYFKSQKDLNKYIYTVTVKDNRPGYECLKSKR